MGTMTLSGGLFALVTVLAFIWAIWMGAKGILADAPPFREGGHPPGQAGSYDPHYTESGHGMSGAA